MSRWMKVLIGAIVAVLVLAGGAYAVLAFITKDAPPPVSLSSVTPSGGGSITAADLKGNWTLAKGSFVGYRVREKLAALPAPSDAVGRTRAVKGTMKIQGSSAAAVDVTADMTQLKSDEARRDHTLQSAGLETNAFPNASFTLSSPIVLQPTPAEGQTVSAKASGSLTVHGQTHDVTVPLQARWSGEGIEVVGSLPITFGDYGISAPSFAGFVSVEDHGTMEFKLEFTPA